MFEALKESKHSIKTVIVITTDKVYKILKNNPNYNENHCLGATDPYGTSKACVELLTETYFHSFFKKKNEYFYSTSRKCYWRWRFLKI